MNIRNWIALGTLSFLIGLATSVPPAEAEIGQLNFILTSYNIQDFKSLIQQAESLAKTSIEQQFADNPSFTEVSVMILGQRNGQIVPILSSKVSRSNWQKEPRIYKWTRYFGSSEVLLGFKEPQASQSGSRAAQLAPRTAPIAPKTSQVDIGDGRGFDGDLD